ncbi:Uu.00g091820.m01.CDS01 [Anthostomella pinea]|uniref:Uu.00g091820.m01.CDS01 n=1 Tax=Anthostomella pinea TaxID=933095 RepID=A0AAI8YKA4_9PEZI|nr:Uu.00g091820.m01.CDS01 [Anthostomella pinea]
MRWDASLFSAMLSLSTLARADPTWPSANDDLEEIMYQVRGYRSRLFGGTVVPCSSEASGPGRHNAAEWVRAAFHDMATTTNFGGMRAGGLDGSIQYELTSSDNLGPGFKTTLEFMADYYTSRTRVADLIALGVYYSIRSCGGPVVPISAGRIDAKQGGGIGVPLPENSAFTFEQQFLRMGFSKQEMIQVTACGHSLGSVHASEFPQIVPPGSGTNDQIPMDSTVAAFDNKVVTEYISGNTTNPLVVGPSVRATRNSDFKVYNSDGNATVKAMAAPADFNNICATVLRKMIEVVPSGVVLSDPVQPYFVKPVDMQLTLNSGASTMQLTGFIRVRTTGLAGGSVWSITLNYKNRGGGGNCGNSNCKITATLLGATQGFDDTFVWFPVNSEISTSTGISSYTVTFTMADGTTQTLDNNGNSYPMQDAILLQKPQSCLISGDLTVTAAVRNDLNSLPVNMFLSMTKGDCVGPYTFYTSTFTGLGELDYAAKIDVVSGSGASAPRDDFNAASELGGTCRSFQSPPSSACTTGRASTTPGSSSTSSSVETVSLSSTVVISATSSASSSILSTPSSVPSTSSSISSDLSSGVTTSTVIVNSTTRSSTGPVETLHHRQSLGGYRLVDCKKESTVPGTRALGSASFAYDGMNLESCMGNCTGYAYWGTEYGRECYCSNSLHPSTEDATLSECNMPCSGDSTEYCGAGNRIELYATTASQPTPTATLAPKPTVSPYIRAGCYNEVPNGRALTGATYANDTMTLELCASLCASFTYWGTEDGRECYCGNTLNALSTPTAEGGCNMACAGNGFEYCGAGNRLELYELETASSSSAVATLTSSSSTAASIVPSTSSSATSLTTLSAVSSGTATRASVITSSSLAASSASSFTSSSSPSSSEVATSSGTLSAVISSSAALPTTSGSTASSSSSTTASATLRHEPTVSSYVFQGCWTEGNGVRALSAKMTSSASEMTLGACADYCADYHYFGAEYGGECYCGNVPDASSNQTALADCNMLCTGNKLQYCGGGNALVLYYSSTTQGPSQPVLISQGGSNYTFLGCQTETSNGPRALAAKSSAADDMTLDKCAAFCDGFAYFGAEYGRECYCGDKFTIGSVEEDASGCSMTCGGNGKQLCGAGNRLSVYGLTRVEDS